MRTPSRSRTWGATTATPSCVAAWPLTPSVTRRPSPRRPDSDSTAVAVRGASGSNRRLVGMAGSGCGSARLLPPPGLLLLAPRLLLVAGAGGAVRPGRLSRTLKGNTPGTSLSRPPLVALAAEGAGAGDEGAEAGGAAGELPAGRATASTSCTVQPPSHSGPRRGSVRRETPAGTCGANAAAEQGALAPSCLRRACLRAHSEPCCAASMRPAQ